MIKGEIMKDKQQYTFDFPQATDIKAVYEALGKIARGTEVYQSDDYILDLSAEGSYQHIRVWIEESLEEVLVVPPGEPDPTRIEDEHGNYIQYFYDKVTYLGVPAQVRGVRAEVAGVPFVLIYEVNDMPALMQLRSEGLKKLAYHVGQVQGAKDPTVILQKGDLADMDEAVAYVEDYLDDLMKKAAELPASEYTAVAAPGINGEENT